MFQYFDPRQYEDYAFQHMVSLASLVLVTGERLGRELMLPWVQCVLTEPCINPVGAQDTGCRWDKKPQFRYSGCHRSVCLAIRNHSGMKLDFDCFHHFIYK